MGTTYKNFSKLTAGVSTRADLISYFNANMDAIDALLAGIYASGTLFGVGGVPSYKLHIQSSIDTVIPDEKRLFIVQNIIDYGYSQVGLQLRNRVGGWDMYIDYNNLLRFQSVVGDPTGAGTEIMKIAPGGDVTILGDCSAATFTDRTPTFTDNALAVIEKIRSDEKGELDHATLPEFAVMPYQDAGGEWWPGRSLGDMISILVKATQERSAQFAAAIADRDAKIAELSAKIDALAAKIPA